MNSIAKRGHSWFRLLFVTAIVPLSARAAEAWGKTPTIDDVRKAWAKRQKDLRTLTIHWTAKYRAVWREPLRGAKPPEGAPKPGEPYSYSYKAVARFDGEKFDLRRRTKDARRFGALEQARYAYDGRHSRSLVFSASLRPPSQGIISSRKHAFGPNFAAFKPPAVVFRPLVPTMSRFKIKELRLQTGKANQVKIDGHTCRLITQQVSNSREYVFYVDLKNNYIVRRIEARVKGRRSIQWDISYSRHKTHGWLPSAWTMEWWSAAGKSGSRTETEVTKYEINKPIPAEEFHILFPGDAKVIDQRKRRKVHGQ